MRPGNRRIGDRLAIDPIRITWALGEPAAPRSRLLRRPKSLSYEGYMIDVSVSGAGILGPAEPRLPLRSRATIRVNDGESIVVIRRAQTAHVAGMLLYGVEFLHLDGRLEAEIYALLSSSRPTEESWLRSR